MAWAQYDREYKRYQAALAEWECQQEMLRNRLSMMMSKPPGPTPPPSVSNRTASHHSIEAPNEDPIHIRIGVPSNTVRRGRNKSSADTDTTRVPKDARSNV